MNRQKTRRKPERPWWRIPVQFLLRLRLRRRHVHGTWIHRLLGERMLSPALWIPNQDAVARGMALGTFVGFLPLPGMQMFFSVLLCYVLRGNIAAAVLATFFSNPFTTLAIVAAQYKFGQWLLPAMRYVDTDEYRTAGRYFATYGKPFLVGALASSVILGLLAYPVTLGVWKLVAAGVEQRKRRRALARALANPGSPPASGPG